MEKVLQRINGKIQRANKFALFLTAIFLLMLITSLFSTLLSEIFGLLFFISIFIKFAVLSSRSITLQCIWLLVTPFFISGIISTFIYQQIPYLRGIIHKYDLTLSFGFIVSISVVYLFAFWLILKGDELERFFAQFKVSLNILSAIYLVVTSLFLVYAYSINDFSHFFSQETIEVLKRFKINEREAVIFASQLMFIPYLISNAILNALVHLFEYKSKYKKSKYERNCLEGSST